MQFNQHLTAQWAVYPPPRAATLVGMKKWLAWLIVGGPVVVYAIGKFLSR
jgi:hypothetical protein